jgi:hypothetical protein
MVSVAFPADSSDWHTEKFQNRTEISFTQRGHKHSVTIYFSPTKQIDRVEVDGYVQKN